jgi:redox-sensitive bicupin YhaK (pirin superfamily)
MKTIEAVIPAIRTMEGEGFYVNRPFPTQTLNFYDPFLLLDEMGPSEVKPGEAKGAPDHPHRGFETVTYLMEGEFEHEDSAGNRGTIETGGVQWMTAGSGVVHSEMPSRNMKVNGGKLHGFQLWVNLPAKLKMSPPRYQEKKSAELPVYNGDKVWIKVIAGDVFGVKAEINTYTPILYWHVKIQSGGKIELPVVENYNLFAYLISGKGIFEKEGDIISGKQMIIFSEENENSIFVENKSEEELNFLLLGGEPIGETVARYGPFVMNTKEEIYQAVEDYQTGKFAEIMR